MKGGRRATEAERNYAFRRVTYDTLVAAKGVISLSTIRGDYSGKEAAKVAGLIMARNLNDFFFLHSYKHDDDINFTDFQLTDWQPDSSAKLTTPLKKRIDKIVGHIVSSKPDPFKNDKEVEGVILPLIGQACAFVRECLLQQAAAYTGDAPKYRRRLNGILGKLGISKLPTK